MPKRFDLALLLYPKPSGMDVATVLLPVDRPFEGLPQRNGCCTHKQSICRKWHKQQRRYLRISALLFVNAFRAGADSPESTFAA